MIKNNKNIIIKVNIVLNCVYSFEKVMNCNKYIKILLGIRHTAQEQAHCK